MPDWLRSALIDKGVLTAQGLSRRAKVITHRPCGMPTMSGIDRDPCGLDAWCDLGQLTADGEFQALLDGRRTYEVSNQRLHPRDRWSIPGHPASPTTVVLAEHRCHQPIPATWCQPPRPARQPRTATEGIPF